MLSQSRSRGKQDVEKIEVHLQKGASGFVLRFLVGSVQERPANTERKKHGGARMLHE